MVVVVVAVMIAATEQEWTCQRWRWRWYKGTSTGQAIYLEDAALTRTGLDSSSEHVFLACGGVGVGIGAGLARAAGALHVLTPPTPGSSLATLSTALLPSYAAHSPSRHSFQTVAKFLAEPA